MKRPMLRYHGSKFKLAPWIISHFPPHKIYIEPYGGGGSVLFCKDRSESEVYNDLDGEVVAVFRVLQNTVHAEQLKEKLYYTPYSRVEFLLAREPTEDLVERARRTIVRAHMGFGSAGATKNNTGFRNDSSRTNSAPALTWMRLTDHLDGFITRFRGVLIEERDALEVIDQHDKPGALFYIDPPYLNETRSVRHGQKYYQHEMTNDDHVTMLGKILQLEGVVVLSGYDNDLYNDTLVGWRHDQIKSRCSGQRGSKERVETIWISPNCEGVQQQMFERVVEK